MFQPNKAGTNTMESYHDPKLRIATIVVLTILAGIFGFSFLNLHHTSPLTTNLHAETSENSLLDFTLYNSYTKNSPIKGSPWKYLAEPYREATLTVSNSEDAELGRYVWEIEGEQMVGSIVTHTFKEVGKYSVKLTDTQSETVLTAEVVCKYVRREIRTLTDEDREATLDALETLYRVSTVKGVNLYGPEYRGMDDFLKQHLDGAGVKDCDHWHDDAGIMTHHVGYTLEVEQSMQLVNPMVSMPYWDYTIDDYLFDSDIGQSVVWGDDWFGEMSPTNDLRIIEKGRWAYVPLPDAGDYDNVNPYGLLRTAWNINSIPYITRNKYLNGEESELGVGCTELQTAFKLDTLADLNEQLNGETHGPVHIKIGGEWGAPGETFASIEGFSGPLVLLAKILWRAGYLRVPSSCEGDGVCVTSCPSELYEMQGKSAYDVMYDLGIFAYIEYEDIEYDRSTDTYHLKDHWNTVAEQQFFSTMLDAMCDTGNVGEMYTSAAPADPSFWILHPAAERFLNLRRIVSDIYPLDETWGYSHKTHIASDDGWVCDWSNALGAFDMPDCTRSYDCSGHQPDDFLEFTFIGSIAGKTFTNQEFYEFMHPYTEDLPYMYDNYDYDHCTEQDISFFD